ncbi:TIGR03086 family metal-binding protein [Nonomuraea lactucae]|uniref:TIGR03086 family metal-binding protein n=1 Tax=Nonomuraea lactucae TaxID=2249762 RepID=UPI000DE4C773|nr:TIGR03086 family metal-binding protein [Nonomuraea lactucae]
MNTVAGRYRTRADAFERKVAGVRPDQWSNQSPCEEWTARDVVRHVIDMHGVMLRPLGRRLSPVPTVDDDPLAAFRSARADVEAVLDDPELALSEDDTPVGRLTVEQHIDQVISADLVIHGWDLARAVGQDDRIDPAEIDRVWKVWQGVFMVLGEDRLRAHGVCGPEVKVPEDAPAQDRLLGLLGRDPS